MQCAVNINKHLPTGRFAHTETSLNVSDMRHTQYEAVAVIFDLLLLLKGLHRFLSCVLCV